MERPILKCFVCKKPTRDIMPGGACRRCWSIREKNVILKCPNCGYALISPKTQELLDIARERGQRIHDNPDKLIVIKSEQSKCTQCEGFKNA